MCSGFLRSSHMFAVLARTPATSAYCCYFDAVTTDPPPALVLCQNTGRIFAVIRINVFPCCRVPPCRADAPSLIFFARSLRSILRAHIRIITSAFTAIRSARAAPGLNAWNLRCVRFAGGAAAATKKCPQHSLGERIFAKRKNIYGAEESQYL